MKKKSFILEYSKQSLENAKEIAAFLNSRFTEKEINNFYQVLEDFEKVIISFPTLYAESSKKKIRKAVLSKVITVYYSINKNKISIISVFDNRWDFESRLK